MKNLDKLTNWRELSNEEVKNMQLKIMDNIHEYCMSNGIHYSLAWGSLLGAIRHKGFIPWDDDIDIMMPRRDYDKMANGIQNAYPDLWLQSFETDETYFYGHSKLVKKGTKYTKFGHTSGVHVDIFILEELPIRKEAFHNYFKKWSKLNSLIWKTTRFPLKQGDSKIMYDLKSLIKRFIYPSRSTLIKSYNSFCHQIKTDEVLYYWYDNSNELMFFSAKDLEDIILLPFEKARYCCISQYDFFLTQSYGDYMQLPPEEKRVLTHNVTYYIEQT